MYRKQALSPSHHPHMTDSFCLSLHTDYAKDVKLNFRPFNMRVQNVQCLRCGEWGHRSGDRECKLKDFNPHDAAR